MLRVVLLIEIALDGRQLQAAMMQDPNQTRAAVCAKGHVLSDLLFVLVQGGGGTDVNALCNGREKPTQFTAAADYPFATANL